MTAGEVDYYGLDELLGEEERLYDMHTPIVGRDITGLDAIR